MLGVVGEFFIYVAGLVGKVRLLGAISFDAKCYRQFLIHIESQIIIELAEVLRLNGSDMPNAFPERITAIQNGFGIDAGILKDLLLYKEKPRRLKYEEAKQFHSNLFHLLDQVVRWMEARWPMTM